MLKPLFLSALLLLTPGLLRAEDPVLFFDGPAHGWKITHTYFTYDRQDHKLLEDGETFVGRLNDNKNYTYYLKSGKIKIVNKNEVGWFMLFHISPGGRFDSGPLIGNQNHFGPPPTPVDTYRDFIDQINYDTDGYYEDIGYDVRYLWNVFLLGREKQYYKDDNKKTKSTYIDYNFELNLDENRNLYIKSSGKNGFFYKIPENMRDKIIIRDRLVYVPNRFLKSAIVKIPVCPKSTTLGFTSERVEACLRTFFRSLPKGDYDDDTPYPIPVKR